MKEFAARTTRLLIGLFLYALGIVITIKADIGYAPWDVFHIGLARTTGMSIGAASVLVGLVVVLLIAAFREKVGLGTVLNMLLIGVFIDFIIGWNIVPAGGSPILGLLEMLVGLYVIAFASYFYIGSGIGAGPRDSLMVFLTRVTRLPVGIVRTGLEIAVTFLGWLLGGKAGFGTLVASLMIGMCIQSTFKLLGFDPTRTVHLSFVGAFRLVRRDSKWIA